MCGQTVLEIQTACPLFPRVCPGKKALRPRGQNHPQFQNAPFQKEIMTTKI